MAARIVSLVIGARLGPYEIVSPIGKGGMGEVYRARDPRLGRDVAIKVLSAGTEQNPERLARFESEARAVAALNHPNIRALHDIGNDSGIAYAVMELLEGETLRDRLVRGGRLPAGTAIEFAIQIAHGLAAAHSRGIIHRDLKPENLFVTRDGGVKILDFGLAQHEPALADEEADARTTRVLTKPGTVLGTPGYLAPEQLVGEPATTRSDLFAFGVVIAEMLTGAHPFRRGTVSGTVSAILREDPPSLESAAPSLPSGVVTLLERCLEKHATDRPESARDLAIYLQAIVGRSESADPTVAAVEVHRARARMAIVSCGLLAIFSLLTWTYVRVMADRAVTAAMDDDLARAEQLARGVQRDRLATLSMTARLVASFPELKALFGTDSATVRDYLVSYQQRNPDSPLLIALGPDGTVIARTDDPRESDRARAWITGLIERRGDPTVVRIGDALYHAAAATADAGDAVFGYVVSAMAIDARFAASLRDATQDEVLLMSDTAVLASTLRAVQTPWRSRDEWRRVGGAVDRPSNVTIGTQEFRAREIVLANEPRLSAIVLKSRNEAIAPFRRIQSGVVVIGALCAVAALGIFWTARGVPPTPRQRG